MSSKEKVVAYFYDEECCNFNYGGGNPMRPHRARLAHSLVEGYGLNNKMLVQRPRLRSSNELTMFHADEYIDFLRSVTPDNQDEYITQMRRFNLGPVGEADCPVFDGMFQYFQTYSGGSVGGSTMLNSGEADICLNWAGGMHHAKKAEASGFCYINDIVLAVLELLKVHQRVLYVDIDIHHGDGVEEAFYTTNRVMTVSFHKYGDFFPGTGALGDIGYGDGKHYAVNVPLREGINDESYRYLYEPIMTKVMEVYQPGAIVMCCGADSLSGDRLGCFNLSLQGHSNCIEFLAKFNVPLLVLGGGGYTMRNVARCWCYETGRMLGMDLPDNLPDSARRQYDYYVDTQRLRISVSNMKNMNTKDRLTDIRDTVLRNLTQLEHAPSAPMQARPPQYEQPEAPEEDLDVRGGGQYYADKRIMKDYDYASDEEDEKPTRDEDGGFRENYGSRASAGYRRGLTVKEEPETGPRTGPSSESGLKPGPAPAPHRSHPASYNAAKAIAREPTPQPSSTRQASPSIARSSSRDLPADAPANPPASHPAVKEEKPAVETGPGAGAGAHVIGHGVGGTGVGGGAHAPDRPVQAAHKPGSAAGGGVRAVSDPPRSAEAAPVATSVTREAPIAPHPRPGAVRISGAAPPTARPAAPSTSHPSAPSPKPRQSTPPPVESSAPTVFQRAPSPRPDPPTSAETAPASPAPLPGAPPQNPYPPPNGQ